MLIERFSTTFLTGLCRCRPYGAKELGQTRFYRDAVATRLKRFLIHARFLCKTRFGFAAYTPKFCPYAAKFVFALHLRRAFVTEQAPTRKP